MLNVVNFLWFRFLFPTFAVMEGNVSDISETLAVMVEEMRKLRASNDMQYSEICCGENLFNSCLDLQHSLNHHGFGGTSRMERVTFLFPSI